MTTLFFSCNDFHLFIICKFRDGLLVKLVVWLLLAITRFLPHLAVEVRVKILLLLHKETGHCKATFTTKWRHRIYCYTTTMVVHGGVLPCILTAVPYL